MSKNKAKGGILLPALICALLWGSAFPGVKTGYSLLGVADDPFSKLYFAGWRFTLAGLLVLLVYAVMYRKSILPPKNLVRGIVLLGLVQTTVQYIFYYIGLSHTTGVKGAVLTATGTFLAVIFSHFVFPDDKINRYKALGCIMGFEGVVLISMGSGELFTAGFTMSGEGFMIISAAGAAAGAVISKIVAHARGADPMIITGWQLTIGGAILLLVGRIGGGHFSQITPKGIALLGYLIFLSAAAFTIWTILLKNFPVGKVTVYNFLTPIFGTLLSGLFLGESVFQVRNIVSLLFVCIGIVLVNFVKIPKEAPTPKKRTNVPSGGRKR